MATTAGKKCNVGKEGRLTQYKYEEYWIIII